ncbi:hypothetical protein B0H13DRAFT_2669737 [Mycena leptocephala]|nr:hypothetical protein B0H13DRAFT_2669737 [Mycena leptocephala]
MPPTLSSCTPYVSLQSKSDIPDGSGFLNRALRHSRRIPHASAARVPSAASLRGAAPLRLHTRAAPVLRSQESSSHCVCGLKFPTRAAIPHREHRTCPRIPSAYLPAIHAGFSRRLVTFPHTVTLQQCTAVTGAAFTPSSRANTHGSRSPLPTPRLSPPARRYRVQRLTIFRSKPASVRDREYDVQPRLPARCACRLHRAPLPLPLRDAAHLLALLSLSIEAFCFPLVGAVTSISSSTAVFYSASPHPVSFRAPRRRLSPLW